MIEHHEVAERRADLGTLGPRDTNRDLSSSRAGPEDREWIRAKWGVSDNNRKARFYSLTSKGREQLTEKSSEWRRLTRAMGLILDSVAGPQDEEA